MGASKVMLFSDQHNKISIYMKALAHPARVAICHHILHAPLSTAVDLQEVIPLSKGTIAQHLKVLRSANIINGFIKSGAVAYQLNASCFGNIEQFCSHFLSLLPPQKDGEPLKTSLGPLHP